FLSSKYVSGTLVIEKTQKLYGIAKVLDSVFETDYDTILKKYGMENASKDEKIKILSKELFPISDAVVSGFKDTGIGYYSRELDAIITYSPSEKMSWSVGMPISQNHGGRYAMENKQWISYRGSELVWGDGIAVFYPIIRNDEAIGYIWAVELDETISAGLSSVYFNLTLTIMIGLGISVMGILFLIKEKAIYVDQLNGYIKHMELDNDFRLPDMKGVYGEINSAINKIAYKLIMQKEMESHMIMTENMLASSFITLSIAHEIKNPLMSIRGFAELIKERSDSNPSVLKYATIIGNEVYRIDRLIGNLLNTSKRVDTVKSKNSVKTLVNETAALCHSNFYREKIECKVTCDKDYLIFCDGNQFKQVMLNLLLNSIASLKNTESKRIDISVECSEKSLRISIADNGCGIPKDKIDEIFQPFWTTKKNSTGLGLFVVKSFIDSMGWIISVESEENSFTRFTLTIPDYTPESENSDAV
ncbi:MAG: GHKL domain-containing protein, partial [Mucispirillum sp.]|nr:GHKL domain-containing protein [Mucispirillum sp.]